MSPRKSKKLKIDLAHLAATLWEHYRNYLDSLESDSPEGEDNEGEENENSDGIGDIDELQELIRLAQESPMSFESTSNNNQMEWKCVGDLIPVLLSVSYYHLAEVAISNFLLKQQELVVESSDAGAGDDDDDDDDDDLNNISKLLIQSLTYFPYNVATWSMGANYGRISRRLSLDVTRAWYEQAVSHVPSLREKALAILQDEAIDPFVKEWVEMLVLNHLLGVELEGDDDDEEEEEGKEKEDGEEEEDDRYSASAVEATARFMCAMLWSMGGQHDKALTHLKCFPLLTHRLHPNVWAIPQTVDATSPTKAPLMFCPDKGILPPMLYEGMLSVFGPDAVYWKESGYGKRGYYSYFIEYNKDKNYKPRNLIEHVIVRHLLTRARQLLSEEEADSICGFEWWPHTRPIQANLGHNLHFDTDESMLAQEGKVSHPILSSVLYLTGGGRKTDGESSHPSPGGATILLDQTPDATQVAEHGWLGIPQDNAFMLFPGNLLHGVLPCPGVVDPNEGEVPTTPSELMQAWKEEPRNKIKEEHRLTFMVGFWTRNVPATMKKRTLYGPCGPLPPGTDEHTWVQKIEQGYQEGNEAKSKNIGDDSAPETMKTKALPKVSPVWEQFQQSTASKDDEPPLIIPHLIDHRFFVPGAPECFRTSLFEDRDDECE